MQGNDNDASGLETQVFTIACYSSNILVVFQSLALVNSVAEKVCLIGASSLIRQRHTVSKGRYNQDPQDSAYAVSQ